MIGAITDQVDKYLGRGRHSIAVPVMDGPLHPNSRLDEAEQVFSAPGLDNLTAVGDVIWFSSGARLMRIPADGDEPETVAEMDAPITCLAADGTTALAIGRDGAGIVLRGGAHDGRQIETLGGFPLRCPTAATFLDTNTIVVTVGARDRPHADWKRDLMAHGSSGEVWRIDLPTGNAMKLAGGLAYPYGVCRAPNGVAFSEAWAHRIVVADSGGTLREVLKDLPGYPARIMSCSRGGYILAVFAPRNQLVEFVLREPEFLDAMTRQVAPDNWIAPKLMWGQGFKEPMQGAALKTMGIIKPWAPTWSYGLVVQLDEAFHPVASYHSRADGHRHGVTSVCERGLTILAGAKGAGVAIALPPTNDAEPR